MNIVITGAGNKNNFASYIAKELKKQSSENFIIALNHPGNLNRGRMENIIDNEIACDLSKPDQIINATSIINSKYQVDIFIHAAGISDICWFQTLRPSRLDEVMQVNFTSSILITYMLQENLTRNKGTVFNVVSVADRIPMRCSLAYNCSKAALNMATQQLARELSDRNITVFGISPTQIANTDMTKRNDEEIPKIRRWSEKEFEHHKYSTITGKLIDPQICAEYIAFLLSKKSRHEMFSGTIIQYGN